MINQNVTNNMKTTKHTAGPWFVSRTSEADLQNGHQAFLVKPIPGQVICECDCLPEEEANAYLIAAAPELLAALKAIVDAEEIDLYVGDEFDNAKKAIVKATQVN